MSALARPSCHEAGPERSRTPPALRSTVPVPVATGRNEHGPEEASPWAPEQTQLPDS